MAENEKIRDMPEAGTPERVAYSLWTDIRHIAPTADDLAERVRHQLDLFAQCLKAARGHSHDTSQLFK